MLLEDIKFTIWWYFIVEGAVVFFFAQKIKDPCIRQHASVKLEGGSLGRQNDPHWVSGPWDKRGELIGLFVYQSKAFNEGDSKGLLSKDL